jgi:hypothetical protein
MDWRANLRWLLPLRRDEYSDVVQTFAPAFIGEFIRRLEGGRDEHIQDSTLFSTGHSLGGGLAQQFAYCLPSDNRVPRVAEVYAFDPSPVTGFFSVEPGIRNVNRQLLKIDRIYERGEILAWVRSVTSVLHKPSAKAPTIRGIRYNLFFAWSPIAGHSMQRMGRKLAEAAEHASDL